MSTLKKRSNFLDSEQAAMIRDVLKAMMGDSKYNTTSSYSANSSQYPDNLIPFMDKHINYINSHPNLDADMYIANLQLMTRVR